MIVTIVFFVDWAWYCGDICRALLPFPWFGKYFYVCFVMIFKLGGGGGGVQLAIQTIFLYVNFCLRYNVLKFFLAPYEDI